MYRLIDWIVAIRERFDVADQVLIAFGVGRGGGNISVLRVQSGNLLVGVGHVISNSFVGFWVQGAISTFLRLMRLRSSVVLVRAVAFAAPAWDSQAVFGHRGAVPTQGACKNTSVCAVVSAVCAAVSALCAVVSAVCAAVF
jgi:hypothetical protein